MTRNFHVLPSRPLEEHTTVHQPGAAQMRKVDFTDPATDVMTDLNNRVIITVSPWISLEEADSKMKQRGIRMLIVIDDHDDVAGLITSNDINGEKPLQFIQKNGGTFTDITVRDIMKFRNQIEVLLFMDVDKSSVGDIVETLKQVNRLHALVVERHEGRHDKLRGIIFSLNQIARQLGITTEHVKAAQTLSEIAALRK